MSKQQTTKGVSFDLSYITPHDCSSCQLGRHSRSPIPKQATYRAGKAFELVHNDLYGPISLASLSNTPYILTFTDDFSEYCSVYFLKKKNEILGVFKNCCALVHNQHKSHIKTLRTDGGGEYCSLAFKDFCAAARIHR